MYVSRRALKHSVERRKEELRDKYDYISILHRLDFVIDSIEIVVQKPDLVLLEETKRIYTKHFEIYANCSIRIIIEYINNRSEIKSMHFQKYKNRRTN